MIISNTNLFTGEEMEDFMAYCESWRAANPRKIKSTRELCQEWRKYRGNNIRLRNENKKLRARIKSLGINPTNGNV